MSARPELPATVEATEALLAAGDYIADRRLATAVFLALRLRRPLFLEGEAGVGKTEIAKVLAAGLARKLGLRRCLLVRRGHGGHHRGLLVFPRLAVIARKRVHSMQAGDVRVASLFH